MRGAEEAKRLDRERTQLNAKARQACEISKGFHALACSPQSWSWKKSDSTPDALRLQRCSCATRYRWQGLLSRLFAFIHGSLLLESAARNHPIKERAS